MQGGEKRTGEATERTRCCIAMCESGERKERRKRKRLRKKRKKEERGMERRRKKRERKEGGGKKKKKKKRRTILWIVLFEKEQLFSVFLCVCYLLKREEKCGTTLPCLSGSEFIYCGLLFKFNSEITKFNMNNFISIDYELQNIGGQNPEGKSKSLLSRYLCRRGHREECCVIVHSAFQGIL